MKKLSKNILPVLFLVVVLITLSACNKEPSRKDILSHKESHITEKKDILGDNKNKEERLTLPITLQNEIILLNERIDKELKESSNIISKLDEVEGDGWPIDDNGNLIPLNVIYRETDKEEARKYKKWIETEKNISKQELDEILIQECRGKNQYAVKVLLNAGASISKDNWPKVIIDKVLYSDNPAEERPENVDEVLKLLLSVNSKIDDKTLSQAFKEACMSGYSKVVKTLLSIGGIDKKDISQALLMTDNFWQLENQGETVSALLAAGADPNIKDVDGNTALMLVENPDAVKALIEAGADVNAKDKEGKTALTLAKEAGNEEIIKLLKAAGAKE